jgi:hypothetical protein
MSGLAGLGSATSINLSQLTQFLSSISGSGILSGSQGAGGAGTVSASISGPGQLYSELQQLQAQNPTEFKQVVSQIASQLEAAAQQQGSSNAGSFLSDLASKFTSVANGGDLSQLQPHQHGHHGHQTYDSNGQASGTQSSSSSSIQQLLQTIISEVTQALNGQSSGQTASSTSGSSSTQPSSSTSIQQLFQTIINEVTQALNGQTNGASSTSSSPA